jgi:hypothetical protein
MQSAFGVQPDGQAEPPDLTASVHRAPRLTRDEMSGILGTTPPPAGSTGCRSYEGCADSAATGNGGFPEEVK